MFIPYGDTNNASTRPYATWSLLAINIGLFFFVALPLSGMEVSIDNPVLSEYYRVTPPENYIVNTMNLYELLVFQYGFRSAAPSLISIFTAQFLHANSFHLINNMVMLYIFGDNIEDRLGRLRFLLAYLFMGIMGLATYATFAPDSHAPLIGASGSIYGVLGLYFIWYPKNQVRAIMFILPTIIQRVLIPARWVLVFFLIIDNILPLVSSESLVGPVAYGAHIGGFLAGLIIAIILSRKKRWQESRVNPRIKPDSLKAEMLRFLALGFHRRAFVSFGCMTMQERNDLCLTDVLHLADSLALSGSHGEAVNVYNYIIDRDPQQKSISHVTIAEKIDLQKRLEVPTS